jgi:hypothetical protein
MKRWVTTMRSRFREKNHSAGGYKTLGRIGEEDRYTPRAPHYIIKSDTSEMPVDFGDIYNIFGLPLNTAVAFNDGYFPQPCVYGTRNLNMPPMTEVPYLVLACVDYIARNITEPGLYRKSGSASQVRELRHRFVREGPTFSISPQEDVHVVTSILKQYLRELPLDLLPMHQCVLSGDVFQPHGGELNMTAAKVAVRELRRALATIPYCNYALLKVLMTHLRDVVDFERQNLMSLNNLACIFSPSLRMNHSVFKLMVLLDPLPNRQPSNGHSSRRTNHAPTNLVYKGLRTSAIFDGAVSITPSTNRRWTITV